MIIKQYYLQPRKQIIRSSGMVSCPHRFLWKARQYGYRSSISITSNQTKFFFKIGGYTEQWVYLWRFIGFWNKPNVEYPTLSTATTYGCRKLYKVFLKKKFLYNTSPHTTNHLDIIDNTTTIKYLNSPNGGFNITHFDNSGERVISIHPGREGEYSGSSRRRSEALIAWWYFLFSRLVSGAEDENTEHYTNPLEHQIRQNLFFKLLTTNNMFLRFFFLLKNYLCLWPTENTYIFIFHNFRKFNLVLKKKRYVKKFKRKFMLPADRLNRRLLLIRPNRNTTVFN